ncbi:MAG: hypothetical protein DLM52_11190 [Chthoniobacterales bacterium]|nr:MAG: hypothetical protein DLM52_11190 [Chthoniobacterales bacterium]
MAKSEVYSWRVSPQMKRALEEAARRQKQTISALLEKIVAQSFRNGVEGWKEDEAALQERLHAAGLAAIGKIKSGRTHRSKRVRQDLRRKLQGKHERARSH